MNNFIILDKKGAIEIDKMSFLFIRAWEELQSTQTGKKVKQKKEEYPIRGREKWEIVFI